MTRKLVYLIGPLFARSKDLMDEYRAEAVKAARAISALDATPLAPHCALLLEPQAGGYERDKNQALQDRLNLLQACDAALLLPGWDRDLDCLIERSQAKTWSIPAFDSASGLAAYLREAA